MPRIDLDELQNAMEFVTACETTGAAAYVSREDGRIWFVSDAVEDDLPDDLDDGSRYLAVPNRRDLDLGQHLVREFVAARAALLNDAVNGIFRHRGAYRRFKDLLERHCLLEDWYAFEQERTVEALKEWCAESGFTTE